MNLLFNFFKINLIHVFFRTTLARWRAAKEAETGERDRRPYLASECSDVSKCEKWRLEIIREISKKVAQIQNGKKLF